MSFSMVALGEVICEEREQVGSFDGDSLPVLGVTNVDGVTSTGIEASEDKSKYIRLRPLRFVYNPYRINVGSIGLSTKNQEGIVSPAYVVFATKDVLDPNFLYYYLKSQKGHELINFYGNRGTVRSALRFKDLCRIEIPLFPLLEQRRIVSRIEELAAKIEEARGLRKMAEEEVDLLPKNARQVIFKNLKEKLAPVRLDSVADSRLGKMLSGDAKTGIGSTPYLRNANIQWDRLDLSSIYEMDFNEDEKENLALQKGDILVCEGGDIGKAAIWNDEIPGCSFQKALHRVRVDPSKIIPRFMLHHIFWAAEQGHFADIKTQTTIAHLTGIKLKAYGVIVPPLPEQRRIVAYLDSLQAKVDALRRLQAETGAELDALLPAVLDKAFKDEI